MYSPLRGVMTILVYVENIIMTINDESKKEY